MTDTTEITVYGYPHNGPPIEDSRPRKPAVQILVCSRFGDVHSVCFNADRTEEVIAAIKAAHVAAVTGIEAKHTVIIEHEQL